VDENSERKAIEYARRVKIAALAKPICEMAAKRYTARKIKTYGLRRRVKNNK
jgi:G:T/U-mismatch repair DNA glycosylase